MRRFQLIVALALALAACRESNAAYKTIIDNGPSSNRVDVVFVGDGYTAADIAAGIYDEHVNSYVDFMFSDSLVVEPFFRYRNYFNVHVVDVVSNESGADVPAEGIYRDTALGASYRGRYLSVNTTKAGFAINDAFAGTGINPEMRFVTVNDTRYGGGGMPRYAVFAGGNSLANAVAMHELGHSFSELGDEYGGGGTWGGGEPLAFANVTADPTGAKWSQWLGYDQPGIGVIGAYEGALGVNTGLYRPSLNSKMRSGGPFNAVSRENILLDIYDVVDPLDSWRDNSTPLTDPGSLFVYRIDDDVIDMQWFVDGTLVPGANGSSFDPRDYGYGVGTYEVTARGFDPTAFDPVDGWVRKDQDKLEQFVTWDVALTAVGPTLGDGNGDGRVDAADYMIWADNWSDNPANDPPGFPFNGDYNDDGLVDGLDYIAWDANYGMGPNEAAAVPEPASWLPLAMAGWLMIGSKRRPLIH